jgi:hypothetical protein
VIFPGKIIGTYQVGRSPLWTLLELLGQLKRPYTASSRHLLGGNDGSRQRPDAAVNSHVLTQIRPELGIRYT